jgi:signal transduction histidine kinase
MTLRARLTWWYSGIFLTLLVTLSSIAYHEFVLEPREREHRAHENKKHSSDENEVGEAINIVLWCGIPVAMLALGGGWWLMHKVLTPIAALTQAAEAINEKNLSQRLKRSGNGDELDRLTDVFNAMIERLENSFQRVREFSLHASHELKTPLTIMHGELETELRNENLPAVQRERLLSQMDEIQRLGKIVDGLTLLTKADAGQASLNVELLRLDDLVRDAYGDAQILAKPGDVQVNLGACEAITVSCDRHRIRQLLLNLTDNAIKYNHPQGTVTMELRRTGQHEVKLTISNTGPGIPAGLLPQVFDPFFRGDKSHSSAVEGCGLGLSIAKWIVTAHRGTIEVASTPGQLTHVIVTFLI